MVLKSLTLTSISFDADDTLWQNEQFFRFTEERFVSLLAPHTDVEGISQRLLAAEKRNLQLYGFGIKGFTLSMIETALELTDGQVPASVVRDILEAGREMLSHPIETLPHVTETLAGLAGNFRLIMITKGDLFDQERKLAQSGLGDYFNAVEIVSDKTRATYERIFTRYGDGPGQSMMVGNSLKSDVLPAIAAGSWGVYVPHALTWNVEHAEPPDGEPRFTQLQHLGELTDLIARIA